MAIYAISDLHLSLAGNKPMNIFGNLWENYEQKLFENWQSIVRPEDYVLIPGDISWAMYLDECYEDFSYINKLNGNKLIFKGNHDYYWESLTKLNNYAKENNFTTLNFIHNTAEKACDYAICGTRGWTLPNNKSKLADAKIFEREKLRLILTLESAKKLNCKEIIVCMHYPPVDKNSENTDFIDIMKEYNVSQCIYGHIHAAAKNRAIVGDFSGVDLKLVSCDYLNFSPLKII